MMVRTTTTLPALAFAATLLAAAASPAHGQDTEDGRWLPYLGCWVEEDVSGGPMTCVVPDGDGVAFLTVADAAVTERRQVRGDQVARPADAAGCTGTESARFSADGHRVFTEAELTCGGAERRTRGLLAFVEPDRWIDVRALVGDGPSVAWVKRYEPAPSERITAAELGERVAPGAGRAAEAARMAASATIRVDELIEAHARTDAEAVRAWIVEHGDPLRLDADRLVRLADAGVPADVIDVAVAVSFPDRFAVARQPGQGAGDAGYGGYGYGRYGGSWGMWSPWGPWHHDPFYFGYDRWYGYSGYGYGYRPYGPSVVVVRPVTTPVTSGGRVVKGRGFVPSGGSARGSATRGSVGTSPPSSGRTAVTGSSSSGSKAKAKRRGGGGQSSI